MNRDIYSKLITKLKSIGTAISGVETDTNQLKEDVTTIQSAITSLQSAVTTLQSSTEFTSATLTPASDDIELRPDNYVVKFGKLLVYHISVKLKGTAGTPIPARTWKNVFTVPSEFKMKTTYQVVGVNLSDASVGASAYYDYGAGAVQIYPYNNVTSDTSFEFLMVGEVKPSA